MEVHLVKRRSVVHVGISLRVDRHPYIASVCNRIWCVDDKNFIGESSKVTCKRCLKYVKEAEENDGYIELKPKRR